MPIGLSSEQLTHFTNHGFWRFQTSWPRRTWHRLRPNTTLSWVGQPPSCNAKGRISHPYDSLDFEERYFAVLAEYPALYEYLSISLPLLNDGVDESTYRCHMGPALFAVLRHSKILDMVESVLGGEVTSNPIQQIRLKPPLSRVPKSGKGYSNIGRTTWHQDHGAAMDDAADTDMLTVWVAMTDASEKAGCLIAAPQSHLPGELAMHCPGVGVAAENYIPRSIGDGRPVVASPKAASSFSTSGPSMPPWTTSRNISAGVLTFATR